jgi:hypothetical protein
VTSSDFNYFDHVHPTELAAQGDGGRTFELSYKFPREGEYYLFADVTPKGDRAQIFRSEIAVKSTGVELAQRHGIRTHPVMVPDVRGGGSKLVMPIPAPRTPQDAAPLDLAAPARSAFAPVVAGPGMPGTGAVMEPVLVELTSMPRTLYTGLHSQLIFRFSDAQGRPITNLEPYLESRGHCMIVSEDASTFLHCHPEDVMGTPADWRGGPDVAFAADFPRAGRYRVWGQFLRGGQLIVAHFTVEVKDSPIPTGLLRFLLND